MKRVFADTSFWIALLSIRDQYHELASGWMSASQAEIVTTEWVLVELGNYSSSRPTRLDYPGFVHELRRAPDSIVLTSSDGLFDAAVDLYAARRDKQWSLTDCASFVIMQQLQIGEALTSDHHFEQAGFEILLK